jgi:hypothetical protein
MGIDKEKLKILGDISYIPLYDSFINKENNKKEIIKKYKLKHDKIIIVGLANWWEHNLSDEETHWNIVFNTIEATIQHQNNYSIILTLHPSMDINNYIFLEKKYNINILQERLMKVLPIADIYVSDQSSTVPWALICGIKTLVICYYKNLNLFNHFDSLFYAKNKNEVSSKLIQLIDTNIDFTHDWKLLSKDKVFNKYIAQNYIDAINELINR